MTPERWHEIERVYLAALERDAGQRIVFLEEVCGHDAALRQEVDSLLSHEPHAAEFLETPSSILRVSVPKSVLPRGVEYLLSKRLLQIAVAVPVTLLVISIVRNRDRTVADVVSEDARYVYWIAAAVLILRLRNKIRTWLERNVFS